MNTYDAIRAQRAVREFSDRPVKSKRIRRILEAGRRAPSSNNDQRWAFIVITDRAHLEDLSTVGAWTAHLAGAAFAVALITPDVVEGWERESIAYDLGNASQNMMLTAWAMGIGSVHGAVYEPELARRLLGYPAGWRCDYLISFGYPRAGVETDEPRKAKDVARRPLDELVHHEWWGGVAPAEMAAERDPAAVAAAVETETYDLEPAFEPEPYQAPEIYQA
jgi:nitroreductase